MLARCYWGLQGSPSWLGVRRRTGRATVGSVLDVSWRNAMTVYYSSFLTSVFGLLLGAGFGAIAGSGFWGTEGARMLVAIPAAIGWGAGGVIGAIAGSTAEIVSAMHKKSQS